MTARAHADGRIRVMLTIGSLAVGGSEKQLSELVARLPQDRFEPVVLTGFSDRPTRHSDRVLSAGVPIVSMPRASGGPISHWARAARQYAAVVRAIDPDVVYAWLDETAAFVAPICWWRRIPCVVARRNIDGSDMERRYPIVGSVVRRAERLATLVTANSHAVASACVARGHAPSRVRLVPNGHDRLPPLPVPRHPPVVFGYVAQFREGKGHHRLLDVVERVPPGEWHVDMAGEGPLLRQVEERVARARLDDRVRFTGPVEDIRDFWRERHVAMLLSDAEGFPNALLEAAFAGRPAIATCVGGTPDVVGPGGILVSLDNPLSIVSAMNALLNDPRRREQLGRHSWEHVADTYAMPRMLAAHVEALEEAHATARRRPAIGLRGRRVLRSPVAEQRVRASDDRQ
jgi:glycosyltransferase involved in cell wall biosynthesis